MKLNYFIFLLIIFLIIFYFCSNFFDYFLEKFVVCENKPSGPYSTHCVLSKFYNNELSAFCKNINLNNEFYLTKLNMDNCQNDDDCISVGVNDHGELTC